MMLRVYLRVLHTGVNPSYVMHWSINGGVTYIKHQIKLDSYMSVLVKMQMKHRGILHHIALFFIIIPWTPFLMDFVVDWNHEIKYSTTCINIRNDSIGSSHDPIRRFPWNCIPNMMPTILLNIKNNSICYRKQY